MGTHWSTWTWWATWPDSMLHYSMTKIWHVQDAIDHKPQQKYIQTQIITPLPSISFILLLLKQEDKS